jgi:hypothetical protein
VRSIEQRELLAQKARETFPDDPNFTWAQLSKVLRDIHWKQQYDPLRWLISTFRIVSEEPMRLNDEPPPFRSMPYDRVETQGLLYDLYERFFRHCQSHLTPPASTIQA